jgi:signal transduction histidine kinase
MVGWIVGLLTFLIFLDKAILIWQLSLLSKLLEDLLMAIPEFITALLILLIGWGVANGVSRAVLRTLYEERVTRPRFTARIIKAGIITLAAAIALIRLGLAVSLVTHAFLLAFGALALAFALAFGLGSRQAVEAMWQDRRQKREDQRVDQTDQK